MRLLICGSVYLCLLDKSLGMYFCSLKDRVCFPQSKFKNIKLHSRVTQYVCNYGPAIVASSASVKISSNKPLETNVVLPLMGTRPHETA